MRDDIELILFPSDLSMASAADQSGINGFIIDWEDRKRFKRQHPGVDLQAPDSSQLLTQMSQACKQPLWCRINEPGEWTAVEVELAIECGADLILLPMVRSVDQVLNFISLVNDRVKTGVLIETVEAVSCASQLSKLALDRVYVGLFDLSISRGSNDLFEPLNDGTVDTLRNTFHSTSFGVAGLTTVDGGHPVPCLDLMGHLKRVGCDFTFLRNSFKNDLAGRDMSEQLLQIHQAWQKV